MKIFDEDTFELDGFVMDNGEVIISDSKSIGDWKKTKIHIEPSMLKMLLEDNTHSIYEKCDLSII